MDRNIFNALKQIQKELQENEKFLNDLDNKIGDGDHGSNMVRGFNFAMEQINEELSVKDAFAKIGQILLSKVGGASGPLYGMAFIKGSQVLNNDLSFKDFGNFIDKVKDSIKKLGKAEVNDKTMIDVWEPISVLFKKEKDIEKIKQEIEKLVAKTKNMIAKKGRASYLGERSIGTIDPGSFSTQIILNNLLEVVC